MSILTLNKKTRGYTLIELIVSVGLFSMVMLLASGAYLIMIGINRQAQGVATGINSLSFALEQMARTIRTGTDYNCAGFGDCPGGGASISFTNANSVSVVYDLPGTVLQETVGGVTRTLTDSSVVIDRLSFFVEGTGDSASEDPPKQPRVIIVVAGKILRATANKGDAFFNIQTSATMRGSDI